jgi:hypothetical protein
VIDKPIFIIGSGRSGTTIFYKLLSIHPQLCWFSNYSDKFINYNIVPIIHRILDWPFIGIKIKNNIINGSKKKFSIRPTEAQNIYHNYCGFKHSVQTTEKNLDFKIEKKFIKTINKHLTLTGKSRFLTKQTANTQRIRLINRIFKDAYYIHIIRDGRAVANSLFNVSWWKDIDIWWNEGKNNDFENIEKNQIELCGLHWKRNVEEILKNKFLFEDRYIEIRYEEFVKDVKKTMNNIIEFCELNNSKTFMKLLPETLKNMNYKWKNNLDKNQQELLNKTLKAFLAKLGYN